MNKSFININTELLELLFFRLLDKCDDSASVTIHTLENHTKNVEEPFTTFDELNSPELTVLGMFKRQQMIKSILSDIVNLKLGRIDNPTFVIKKPDGVFRVNIDNSWSKLELIPLGY